VRAFLGVVLGAIVGFWLAVLLNMSWLVGDPRLDIYWGPPVGIALLYLPLLVSESVSLLVYVLGMPAWWAWLLAAAFTRRRRIAVVLYLLHVGVTPLLRFLRKGHTFPYLIEDDAPDLWLAWTPMLLFTVWYFTMAFGIRWREVGRRAWARWRAWRGGVEG